MYIHIYVYIYVHAYIYIHISIHIYISLYIYICIYVYISQGMCIHVCIHLQHTEPLKKNLGTQGGKSGNLQISFRHFMFGIVVEICRFQLKCDTAK